eukprot:6503247-Prymnesium_polylepis.1
MGGRGALRVCCTPSVAWTVHHRLRRGQHVATAVLSDESTSRPLSRDCSPGGRSRARAPRSQAL